VDYIDGGEIHTVEIAGSNPAASTIQINGLRVFLKNAADAYLRAMKKVPESHVATDAFCAAFATVSATLF